MNKLSILIICVLTVCSCSEDFLNREPLASETDETFFNTDENALKSLYAVYNVIRGRESFGGSKWAIGSIGSDLAEAGGTPGGSDIMDMQNVDRLMHDARNVSVVEWYWYAGYTGILRANLVIDKIEQNENITPDLRDRIVGEAYCMRGLFHFELAMTYGPVPVNDHVLSSNEYQSITRLAIADVIGFAIADFDKATKYLEQFAGKRIHGRVDVSTARALKLKALVYESSYSELNDPNNIFEGCNSRWEEAQILANDIISKETIYGVGLLADYHHVWRQAYETESEFLLSASSTIIAGMEGGYISTGSTDFETRESTSNKITVMQSPRRYYETLGSPSRPPRDGWGFNVPTQKFVDMFDAEDPRLRASVVFNKTPWNYWNHGDVFLSTEESPTGYSCLKYVAYGDENDDVAEPHASNLDDKIYRYADFLLLAAEANLKAGDAITATSLVNRVRTRARNSGATNVPADYSTNVTMKDILLERALELGLEGHRFYDLVRTGNTQEMNGANNFNETIQRELTFVTGKHEFLPIPASEIVRTGGALKQNNGY